MTTWYDLLSKYEESMGADSALRLANALAMAEATSVTSMRRNIGYHSNPNYTMDGNAPFEMVYNVIIVTRENPALLQIAKQNGVEKMYNEMVYGKTKECVEAWYAIAIAILTGTEIDDLDLTDPRFDIVRREIHGDTIPTPGKIGSPLVTVYGDVIDAEGRVMSVTMTDQASIKEVYDRTGYAIGLYDEVTRISHNHNMNKKGAIPYRNVAPGKKTKRSQPTAKTKKNATNAKPKTSRTVPKTPKATKPTTVKGSREAPKPQVKRVINVVKTKDQTYCKTFAEVRTLPNKTDFNMPISAVELKFRSGGGILIKIYGFTQTATEGFTADTHDSVYLNDTYQEFDNVLAEIQKVITELDANKEGFYEVPDGTEVYVVAKKAVSSKTQNVTYINIGIKR